MEFIKKFWFWIIGATIMASGVGVAVLDQPKPITLEAPSQVVWNKPTTDKEWAEDVKVENLDVRSTGTLKEMKQMHIDKLNRVNKDQAEILECPECVKFSIAQRNPTWTQEQILTEYNIEHGKVVQLVEKLKQSIERIDNEIRLRDEGFVVVKGEDIGLLGSFKTPYAIRIPI